MNLEIYDKVRKVPNEAQKPITGGRLKGFTDINPMWRIKTLTEQFGMVGIGWYYDITEKRFEKGGNDEIAVFVDIDLYIKVDGEWSKPIPGTGGSIFVAKESKGLFTSDECIKMALTDALSVACKSIGMGADVYWQKDSNKYDNGYGNNSGNNTSALTEPQIKRLFAIGYSKGFDRDKVLKSIKKDYGHDKAEELTKQEYDALCNRLESYVKE